MPFKKFGTKKLDKSHTLKPIAGKRRPRKMVVIDAEPARSGRMTLREKSIIDKVVAESVQDITPAQEKGLAVMLKRDPDTIADAVAQAREKLQANLGRYVDIHLTAAENALTDGDPDVARKAAEFMIEKVSAKRRDGKVERLIDAPSNESQGPRIQIGIALGGMPASNAPTIVDSH